MEVKKELVSSRERSRGYMPRQLAKDARKTTIRLDRNNASAWVNKGIALEKLGRDAEAKAARARGEELEAKEPKW
jgi:Flp pilus assembly protein TadD